MMSVEGYHEYTEGYHDECGGYHETPRDVQYTGVSIQIRLFSQLPFPTFITISWYPTVY